MPIKVINLTHSFHNKIILNKINFEIYEGDKFCIIGKSGEGKSVLFRLMTGLIQPSSGQIFIDDQSVYPLNSAISQKIGVVFQNPALIDTFNVWENIGIKDIYCNLPSSLILEKVNKILPLVGLKKEDAFKKVDELSGGMKKRVSIARALYHEPKILFFDEPQTGLDPINAQLIDDLILKLFQPSQILIMITHHMLSVQKIANKVLLIDNQKGYFFDNMNDFYQTSLPTLKEFFRLSLSS